MFHIVQHDIKFSKGGQRCECDDEGNNTIQTDGPALPWYYKEPPVQDLYTEQYCELCTENDVNHQCHTDVLNMPFSSGNCLLLVMLCICPVSVNRAMKNIIEILDFQLAYPQK